MRPISIGSEPSITPEEQPLPELSWVDIDGLVIDDQYQRPLGKANWARIRAIAAQFRWSRFSPILVAPMPEGGFAIVDGQHRVHAAKICGFERVPAMIVQMDKREQARSFSWVNDQVTRISTFHIYKAALAANDRWAVACRDAVEAAGCTLMTSNASTNKKQVGQIFAVALIRQLVEKGQSRAVTVGLRALKAYDVTDRVPLYSAVILRPWLTALAVKEEFLDLDLVAFLNTHDPYRVIDRLERLRRESGRTGKTPAKLERDAFVKLLETFAARDCENQ